MPSSDTRSAKGAGTIRKKTITNNGKNYTYWEARYTVGTDPVTGKQIQRSVTGKSKTEVSQKLRQATVEIDQGTYVDPTKLTENEWMDFWQKEYLLGVKPSTANLYKECIRLYISPLIGNVRMDKLTGPMVQRFYNELYLPSDPGRNPVSPKSVKNVHGILHKAFQQAVRNGMLRLNPTESCVLPKIYKKEIQPLTSEQIAALLRILPGHPHEYLFQIALYTGMREGELLGLTWDCVDFAHGTILVKQQLQREHKTGGEYHLLPTKNGKKRVVPMAPSVARLFELQKARQDFDRERMGSYWEETGMVFTNPWGSIMAIGVALALSVPAALIYRRHTSRKGALAGIVVGALCAIVAAVIGNLFITPLYAHMSMAAVAKMIVPILLPFNLIKFILHGVITFLIYKPISNLLNR